MKIFIFVQIYLIINTMHLENFLNFKNPRIEKKFICDNHSIKQCENIIKTIKPYFIKSYPKRIINNIYFDNIDRASYFENIEGISERFKIRIRWYDQLLSNAINPKIEIKSKKNNVSYKNNISIKNFKFKNNIKFKKLSDWTIDERKIYPFLELLKSYEISSINTYLREYFITIDKKVRLTLDYNIKFYNKNMIHFSNYSMSRNYTVIELKYNLDQIKTGSYISNKIPYRMSKHSKYVEGIFNEFARQYS